MTNTLPKGYEMETIDNGDYIICRLLKDGEVIASERSYEEAVKAIKEENTMNATMTETTFELDGTVYNCTEKGCCYKSTGKKDKKGNDLMMRISRAVFEQALEQYFDLASEVDEEQDEFDTAYEERQRAAEEEAERQAENDRIAEAEVNKQQTEKKPTAKKRAPRNKNTQLFVVDGLEIRLTDKQIDFIKHLPDTCFWERGLDSTLWVDVLVDEIGGQFEEKPMTVGAMISTLREKDLLYVNIGEVNGRKAKYIELAPVGRVIAKELGLE